jgi:two-component system CheB/CheR fusion protein
MSKQSGLAPICEKPVVVAIGASAGGLAAFERFFKAAPKDLGMAFILLPHLDPKRHSLMVDLVGKYTEMPVVQAGDNMPVEINTVYIIPPNKYLAIREGVLFLEKPVEYRGVRMAIDYFFRSLAESERERAICIVLSGTGTDGTQGLKSIKGNGGLAVVQEPTSAQYDGMPVSCIRTGVVDFIMPPESIPEMLGQYRQHQYLKTPPETPEEVLASANDNNVEAILSIVRARTRHDFRHYKRGTMVRRIQRRMGLRQLHTMEDYLHLLRKDVHEVTRLFDDLLIGVTQFFRDADAFGELEMTVIQALVNRADDRNIRVWVAGCSTGEEAYSLAIALIDMADSMGVHINLQIFATDVDERALSFGRAALYPESIVGDVSEARLRRYFIREDHNYRVAKQVRDTVVFAKQDLIYDPPFSKLDLISCRNLLIYLNADIQYRILSLFSFSLNEDSFMFLGGSETIGRADGLFKAQGDKKSRIFKKIKNPSNFDRLPFPVSNTPRTFTPKPAYDEVLNGSSQGLAPYIHGILLERYAPAAVVVSEKFEIMQIFGSTGDYLEVPSGPPTNDLLSMARRGLRIKIRKLVHKAISERRTVVDHASIQGGDVKEATMTARTLAHPKIAENLCLLTFEPRNVTTKAGSRPPIELTSGDEESLIMQLENELKTIREELQGTIEELETSNEELKTSNEEAMSMNEELQSTNEELETSKEELQSLNEELTTVNSELQEKLEELEKTNDDLGNLLASTELATLFLDPIGRIRRFTPSAKRLFNLISSDVGRSISDIVNRLKDGGDLIDDARSVIEELRPLQNEVQDGAGNWYIRRVIPYRTSDNRIDGVVVTFVEITALKKAEAGLRNSEARYRSLYENTPAMYFTLDEELIVQSVNQFGVTQLGVKMESLIGESFPSLYVDPDYIQDVLYRATKVAERLERWESKMLGANTGGIWVRCMTRALNVDGEISIFVVCQDISNEKRLSDELHFRSTHDYLTGLLNRREFDLVLERLLVDSKPTDIGHSVLYIDLSRFKLVNDTAGHAAGDHVLKNVAVLLRKFTRKNDIVARLGGDEFGIVMESCSIFEARNIAENLVKVIQDHEFNWPGHRFDLTCCIGIVEILDNHLQPDEVVRRADVACYIAHGEGPGSVRAFDESDIKDASRRAEMRWGGLIRRVIDDDIIELVCEPFVEGPNAKVVGFEFLSRVKEDGVVLDTGALIAAAERYGMAPEFDLHVVAKALKILGQHLSELAQLELISINISGQSLGRPEVASQILTLLADTNLPMSKLCFEITETATISNLARAIEFVKALRQVGCHVAIDDFGSGLASFHYLKSLPCDLIKIDGAFVRDIDNSESERAVVAAIDNIAKLYGVRTIAECVENERIDNALKRIGVDYRQGYLFGHNLSIRELLDSL